MTESKKTTKHTITLSNDTYRTLAMIAKKSGMNAPTLARKVIAGYVEDHILAPEKEA